MCHLGPHPRPRAAGKYQHTNYKDLDHLCVPGLCKIGTSIEKHRWLVSPEEALRDEAVIPGLIEQVQDQLPDSSGSLLPQGCSSVLCCPHLWPLTLPATRFLCPERVVWARQHWWPSWPAWRCLWFTMRPPVSGPCPLLVLGGLSWVEEKPGPEPTAGLLPSSTTFSVI
jgi:hypothetical protein